MQFFCTFSVDDLGASNFSTGLNSLNSSGMPTPLSSGTRPTSETNSVDPSCSSALSGVDDRKLDEILGDGIQNQTIYENMVTQELQTQNQIEEEAAQQVKMTLFLRICKKKFNLFNLQRALLNGRNCLVILVVLNRLLAKIAAYKTFLTIATLLLNRYMTKKTPVIFA